MFRMRFTFWWFRVRVRFSVTFGPMVRVSPTMRVFGLGEDDR